MNKNKWLSVFQEGRFVSTTRITLDVIWNIILFFLVLGFIVAFFLGGLGVGYFASLTEDLEASDREEMGKQIYNYEETSNIYFANNVHMGKLRSDLHREEVKLEEVSDHLKDAIKATEDEYFETHNGVVPKAIFRALFQEFSNADMQSGGSTLTQQLIKSQILTNEVSFERKAKEILVALRLERFFEKDEIFEAYLNIVPFGRDSSGRNIAGVQAAAQGLFDVDADELNIAQAAFIAGLPQSPSVYTPFDNGGNLKSEEDLQPGLERQRIVLSRMLREEIIDEETYEEALDYDVIGNLTDKKESTISDYPFLTFEIEDRAIEQMTKVLAEEDGYTMEELQENDKLLEQYEIRAERDLRQNGYEIHTTIDKDIYDAFQQVTREYPYFEPTRTVYRYDEENDEQIEIEMPVEAGAMLKDNRTGAILAFTGGRDFERSEINHFSYHQRPNGSTMKPFWYASAIDMGIASPGSPLADVKFGNQLVNELGGWSPSNYISGSQSGIVSAREALKDSDNLPASRLAIDMLNRKGRHEELSNYLNNMGFDGNEFAPNRLYAPGVLGPVYVSLEETTNAFSVFANGGKFKDSYMIEKITDGDGNTIYEHETNELDVFSPQTAYLTLDILRDVLTQGTATYARGQLSNPSVDWAGKTGTSNGWMDALFVGTNPNVTLGTWIGYDEYDINGDGQVSEHEKEVMNLNNCRNCSLSYSQRNLGYWSSLVNAATEVNPDLMAPQERHESPGGIVSRNYCQISGLLPSEACQELGLVKTDLFNIDHVPTKKDDSVTEGEYVQIGDEYYEAIDSTPEEFVEEGFFLRPGFVEEQGWDDIEDISQLLPDNEAWANLVVPEDGPPEDDGSPSAPKGVQMNGSKLTWSELDGDVIGYKVYMKESEDDDFELIDSTKEPGVEVSKNRIYAVKAVDFFGNESDHSSSVTYGEIEEPEDDEKDEKDKKDKDKDRKDKRKRDNDEDQEDDEGGDEEDGEDGEDGEDDEGGDGDSGNGNGNGDEESNDETAFLNPITNSKFLLF
ncbi:transglycosylase domain-containing protein [Piscibacillus halophilus]|uniref:Penicillin-binding protein n=1 Tax=Piscibacillus halophilus TaxID=571933 RepID=A0A1H9FJ50_9BACI|nr:transglycosylase domain-containing protein [Piscibacillus halophilus]SEQ37922.1 penicillin-binding protein [Piscibacillus halophilus]